MCDRCYQELAKLMPDGLWPPLPAYGPHREPIKTHVVDMKRGMFEGVMTKPKPLETRPLLFYIGYDYGSMQQ